MSILSDRRLASFCLMILCVACAEKLTDVEYLQRGQALFDEGNHSAAVIEMKNALQQNPGFGEARLLLGQTYLVLGQNADAEKELLLALESGIPDEAVLPLLAQALQRQGKNEALQALALNDVQAPENLAVVLAAKGLGSLDARETSAAQAQIAQALELDAMSPYVRVAKARLSLASFEADFAVDELQALLEEAPNYGPAWSLLGDIEMSRARLVEAEEAYTRAIDTRVDNLEDRLRRARTRVRLGKLELAEEDLDILAERMPRHPDVMFTRAQAYILQEKWNEARILLEDVLAHGQDANELEAVFYLGLANLRLGSGAQAEEYAERFFSRKPGSIEGRKLVAAIMIEKGDYERVRELLEPVLAANPEDLKTATMLARALTGLGNHSAAADLLQKVADAQPESAAARTRLGLVLYSDGQTARALEQLIGAAELKPDAPAATLAAVTVLLQEGEHDQALQLAQAFREAAPGDLTGEKLLAKVYLASGQITAANQMLANIIEKSPADRFTNFALAAQAMQEKRFDDVKRYYEAVLAGSPDDLDALLNLARLSVAANDEPGMLKYLQRAVDAHPKAAQPRLILARYYFFSGKTEKVAPLTLQLSEIQKRAPEVQEFLGMVSLAQNRYEDARFYLESLVQQQPDSSRAHYLLSRAYARLEENKRWRTELERSLELDPDNYLARKALAYAYLIEGDFERAGAELSEVEKRFPNAADLLHLRAAIARGEGNQEQATELLARAFAAAPSTPAMLSVAGQLWHSGDRAGAVALQEEWLDENPDDPYASLALGIAYTEQNSTSNAVKQFEKLLAKDEDNPDLLNALAWLLRQDETERALRYARQARELRPRDGNITDTLAVVLYYSGDIERANSTIDLALEQLPGNPALRYHKAMIDAAAGNEQRAAEMLGELLAEGTDFDEREEAMAFLDTLQ